MRAKERNTRKNTAPILEPSFLNEDFYIEDYREGQLQQVIEAVSDATHFLVVDPSQFKIFSMIDGSKDDSMKMLVLDPDYASVNMLIPDGNKKGYFRRENGNIGNCKIQSLTQMGMTTEQIQEIKSNGFFLQYRGEKSTLTLIPSKAFLATLCRQLGIGKLNSGPDGVRDIYLASRLRCAEEFAIIYRKTANGYGKVFGCFSPKFAYMPQTVAFDFMDALSKLSGNESSVTIRQWKITHFYTSIYFTMDELVEVIGGVKITPGVCLTLSDVGDASYSLESTLYLNGGVVLFDDKISRRHTGTVDATEMVDEYSSKFQKLHDIMIQLHESLDINIPNKAKSAADLLKKIKFNTSFGIRNAIAYKDEYLTKSQKSCTGFDLYMEILKIPGIVHGIHRKELEDQVSRSIGRVFDVNLKGVQE